jgi:hypothetical protein
MILSVAQEQTIKRDAIYPPSPVFPHGQLYMTIPKSSSFDNVAVSIIEGQRQRVYNDRFMTSNAVYREVL